MLLLKDDEFTMIVTYIKSNLGVNLEKKRPLIEGRLGNYVEDKGFTNYRDFFEYAIKDPTKNEMVNIINKLTTNHTYFFRENEHFKFYTEKILPWVENDLKETDLRIWSAGCSSGQEPYTLSITTFEYLGAKASNWESTILASDISDKVLKKAMDGVYSKDEVNDIPKDWLNTYFTKQGENYVVCPKLRKNVAFRNINLLNPFSFKKKFHAIFCRNVMIYFDIPTKNQLIAKYYDLLVPGGYFMIGHSESLSACTHNFNYVKPSIYRKPLN